LIVVFGLGGAPGTAFEEMGRIAAERSDQLILTTSGFRGSPPILGLGSLLAGARRAAGGELEVVLDRHRAILRAVQQATDDDVVLIPGRGALGDMRADPRGEPIRFDDRDVARGILCERQAERAVVPQSLTATPRRFRTPRRPSSAV
jgi:UDP-N-acetylmuramoyl-L-alanyl-D-glutamate--2,6-diaminopimelate ligase